MNNPIKLLSGLLAFFLYFLLIGLFLYSFYTHPDTKSTHYVEKSSDSIVVSLAGAPKQAPTLKKVLKSKKNSKKTPKRREKQSLKTEAKRAHKRVKSSTKNIRSKKDKKDNRATNRADVNSLFNSVKEKRPAKTIESRDKRLKNETIRREKKRDQERGTQNAYFAKIELALQNWPSQSEFAGETVKIWLKIEKDGSFTFKLLSASNNEDFNTGLIQYIKQLQKIGFDPHKNTKPYELNVEFIAKE